MNRRHFIFDVESIGLHGEGFAWGAVVVDGAGVVIAEDSGSCDPAEARGTDLDREWVRCECPDLYRSHVAPEAVREDFFGFLLNHREKAKADGRDLLIWAECGWPVEARFLAAAIDDNSRLEGDGPYPLHEIATAMLLAGMDPMATYVRLPSELPKHDPLADARQSARLLVEALRKIEANQ